MSHKVHHWTDGEWTYPGGKKHYRTACNRGVGAKRVTIHDHEVTCGQCLRSMESRRKKEQANE
jgi:hypothetical protein